MQIRCTDCNFSDGTLKTGDEGPRRKQKRMRMTLNEIKTECMVIDKGEGLHWCGILVTIKPIKRKQSFGHLGSFLIENSKPRADIRSRITQIKTSIFNS